METRDGLTKLEVGSGNRPRPGYLHLDVNPDLPELDYVGTMDEIPLPDECMTEVLSIHSIEHLSLPTARKALKEFARILKPGGALVCDTPNIHRNAMLYLNGGWEQDFATLTPEEQAMCSLNGVPNKSLHFNFKVFSTPNPFDTHYWNADPELLTALCLEAGFAKVDVIQYSPSLCVRAYK